MLNFTLCRKLCARPLLVAIAVAAMSCTENAPPKSDHNPNAVLPSDVHLLQSPGSEPVIVRTSPGAITPATEIPAATPPVNLSAAQPIAPATPPKLAVSPVKPVLPKEDIVIPPADAHWTLFIAGFDGPNHVETAKASREKLNAATGSSKFYIVHEDSKSCIYYGFYKDIDARYKEGKVARSDMEYLKGLKTSDGESPLSMIYFTPVTTATPDAPKEWDLAKIGRSPEHYWSLQIAAYTPDGRAEAAGDVADRKSAAVESVRELRAHGIEAYYYHGEVVSSVCVGAWPENSVKRQNGGNNAGNAATVNPDQPLFVGDLPPNVKAMHTREGEKIQTLSQKLEVLNPDMLAVMKQFPTHAVNGYEIMHSYGKGKQKQTLPDPSVLVLLPETKTAMPTGLPSDADMLNLQLRPDNSSVQQPGVGRLRSVGQ